MEYKFHFEFDRYKITLKFLYKFSILIFYVYPVTDR